MNAEHSLCPNCGAPAPLSFCPVCGQKTTLHSLTVGAFAHEFITHTVALEGALWRTLAALLVYPGRLTADYFEGRRAYYVAPLRLYLTFSLVFFAVSGFGGADINFMNQGIKFALPQKDALYVAPVHSSSVTGIAVIDRALSRVRSMSDDQKAAHLGAAVKTFLPYVLILMVPTLALLLKAIYWNRERLYGEHLVIALHAQTAALIFALVSAIPLGEIYGFAIFGLFFTQGALALQKVYGGRLWTTVMREAMLLSMYGLLLMVAVSFLAILSIFLS